MIYHGGWFAPPGKVGERPCGIRHDLERQGGVMLLEAGNSWSKIKVSYCHSPWRGARRW